MRARTARPTYRDRDYKRLGDIDRVHIRSLLFAAPIPSRVRLE